jgi:hypothetical protein
MKTGFFKYGLILFSFLIVQRIASSQNVKTVIKTQAMEMVSALLKKDFETFTKYMHPKIIELAGGKAQLLSKMDTASKIADKFGAKISRVLIGHPDDVIEYKKQLQCTLSQTTDIRSLLGTMTLQSTLIAISEDAGKHWFFIDTAAYNLDEIKKSLPDLSPEIKVPPMPEPKFTPNDPDG